MAESKRLMSVVLGFGTALLIVLGLQVFGLLSLNGYEQSTTSALCSLRDDLQKRVDSTASFLLTHPHGFAGIPAATLRVSLVNEQHTLKALSPLVC